MLAPEAALNPAQKSTNTVPSLLEPKAPLVSLLASPPPSPSRNSIFNQSWSFSSGPNVSSLRPRSDSTTSATSTSSLIDQHFRNSPRFGATDDNEGSYSTKFYHHSNNSSQSNLRNKPVAALQEGTNTSSSSNSPFENNDRPYKTDISTEYNSKRINIITYTARPESVTDYVASPYPSTLVVAIAIRLSLQAIAFVYATLSYGALMARTGKSGRAEDDILNRLQHHSEHHLGRQFVVDYIGLYDTSTNNIEYRPGSDSSNSPLSEESQKCLLLEYCSGGTIWDWIRLHPEQVGLQQWLVWARQLLLAVDYIHEAGLIHHDIKPHNILLTAALDAKLSDFGGGVFLPKSKEHPALRVPEGLGRGTQPYSAPELFASVSSSSTYGQGIDIYSLGVSLYVIGLTAQEPFHKMKSMLEMVVWIKKGGFWLWEDQSWVHDRGQVPKDLENNRRSISSLSRNHSLRHANSGGTLDKSLRSSSSKLSKQVNVDVSGLPLAPIITCLAVEERHLSVNSGSPERTFKNSRPCTPVSPLPLPSPIIGPLTPRSPGLMDDRRASAETVMRFLNGEIVPSNIVQLLKEMCHPDPQRRPDAKHILNILDEIETEHFTEHTG
ncbi:hypothetical protein BGZ82_009382 [Podila clonocystis]|nr:hypothetical protein BGZ82_009382 [Podila clonocystis]